MEKNSISNDTFTRPKKTGQVKFIPQQPGHVFFSSHCTLAKTEIIYPKNVRAKVAKDFTQDK